MTPAGLLHTLRELDRRLDVAAREPWFWWVFFVVIYAAALWVRFGR